MYCAVSPFQLWSFILWGKVMALTQALVLFYGVPRFGTQHLYGLGIFVANNNCMGILASPTVDFFSPTFLSKVFRERLPSCGF